MKKHRIPRKKKKLFKKVYKILDESGYNTFKKDMSCDLMMYGVCGVEFNNGKVKLMSIYELEKQRGLL